MHLRSQTRSLRKNKLVNIFYFINSTVTVDLFINVQNAEECDATKV